MSNWLTCKGAQRHRPSHVNRLCLGGRAPVAQCSETPYVQRMPTTAADLWWGAAPLLATPPAAPGAPAAAAGGQARPSPALPLLRHCWKGLTLRQAQPCCRGSPASDACSRGITALVF